jgi:hypothetical protein
VPKGLDLVVFSACDDPGAVERFYHLLQHVFPTVLLDNKKCLQIKNKHLRQGKLAVALPANRSLQQIAAADIGAFVAAVIERGDTVFGRASRTGVFSIKARENPQPNQSMKPTAHLEICPVCLPRHPAVAYLCLV